MTLEQLVQATASVYGIAAKDILGRRRTKSIAEARHVVCFLARRLTALSLEEIGAWLGGGDHSTVLSAVAGIQRRSSEDGELRGRVARIAAMADSAAGAVA